MVSRCPSCGSPTKEDERICPSCRWDFVAHKRSPEPEKEAPTAPPAPSAPPPQPPSSFQAVPGPGAPAGGGFALPPAKNLNEQAPSQPLGLRAFPPRETLKSPGPNENPFTLPNSMKAESPAEVKPAAAPKKTEAPADNSSVTRPRPNTDSSVTKPRPDPEENGSITSRLLRSFLGAPKPAVAAPPPIEAAPPFVEPEQQGFSLPLARAIAVPSEKPPAVDENSEAAPLAPAKADRKPTPAEKKIEEPPQTPPAASDPKEDAPDVLELDDASESASTMEEPGKTLSPQEEIASTREDAIVPPLTAREVRPTPKNDAKPPQTAVPETAVNRNTLVIVAAVAGAALGTVSVLAVYLLMRPDPPLGAASVFARKPTASAPTEPAATPPAREELPPQSPPPLREAPSSPAPAPTAAPAPAEPPPPEYPHPGANFDQTPKLIINRQSPPPLPPKPAPTAESKQEKTGEDAAQKTTAPQEDAPSKPTASQEDAPPKPRKPKGAKWVFEGTVFDLLTLQGVYAANLVFVDANGDVAGKAESGPGGKYKITLPAGSGYKLKISQGDYPGNYIDEGDATSSLKDVSPDDRKMLMHASARNIPWIGDPKKPTTRDLALVPSSPEDP